ncbi:hypothetical protein DL98DRAFT_655399 [Cadophora sp. DSE1049]|nr:hypothetical protein DL98DRAFT_655399 [Cadophora sp. DSE1049]
MPLHFNFPWASHLTSAVEAALLLPLTFLREFFLEDVPRTALYVINIYSRCASIILSTTIYCSRLLLAGFVQYTTFTLVWIQMSLRLCLVAYTIYILGRSLQAVCEFVVSSPIYMVLAAAGITQLPMLFRYLVPILKLARLVDRAIRTMIFKLNAMVVKKKPKRFVVIRPVEVVSQGTQTAEAWDKIKEKVKIREMNRLDGHPNDSDEDWETDSEDGHGELADVIHCFSLAFLHNKLEICRAQTTTRPNTCYTPIPPDSLSVKILLYTSAPDRAPWTPLPQAIQSSSRFRPSSRASTTLLSISSRYCSYEYPKTSLGIGMLLAYMVLSTVLDYIIHAFFTTPVHRLPLAIALMFVAVAWYLHRLVKELDRSVLRDAVTAAVLAAVEQAKFLGYGEESGSEGEGSSEGKENGYAGRTRGRVRTGGLEHGCLAGRPEVEKERLDAGQRLDGWSTLGLEGST